MNENDKKESAEEMLEEILEEQVEQTEALISIKRGVNILVIVFVGIPAIALLIWGIGFVVSLIQGR